MQEKYLFLHIMDADLVKKDLPKATLAEMI